MMNTSGSEFTLRVAICDLVERLKRMQHKCSYLEQCRNQLVKEVIRLRLQNEWLAKQAHDNAPGPSSLPQNIHCLCNNNKAAVSSGHNSSYYAHHHHLPTVTNCQVPSMTGGTGGSCAVGDIPSNMLLDTNNSSGGSSHSNTKDVDSLYLMNILAQFEQADLDDPHDSIKLLTIQMLKELEEEMRGGGVKSELLGMLGDPMSLNSLGEETTATTGSTAPSGPTAMNSLMKFDNDEPLIMKSKTTSANNLKQIGSIISNNDQTKLSVTSSNYEALNDNTDYYSNSHNLLIDGLDENLKRTSEGDELCDINKHTPLDVLLLSQQHQDSRVANGSYSSSMDNKGQSELLMSDIELTKLIVAVKNDLKDIHQGVLSSTERLTQLKSKQLRNFFEKQINKDSVTTKTKSSNVLLQRSDGDGSVQ